MSLLNRYETGDLQKGQNANSFASLTTDAYFEPVTKELMELRVVVCTALRE
jgi:hypothetical protein